MFYYSLKYTLRSVTITRGARIFIQYSALQFCTVSRPEQLHYLRTKLSFAHQPSSAIHHPSPPDADLADASTTHD